MMLDAGVFLGTVSRMNKMFQGTQETEVRGEGTL